MKLKIIVITFLITFYYDNAYCQQHNQSSSALATLNAIDEDANGFDGTIGISNPAHIPQDDITIPVPEPSFVLPDFIHEKGATNDLSVLILKELGNPPSEGEANKIDKALDILNNTKIGKEICKSVSGKTACTWDVLKKAKVEITTRNLQYHLPEPLESMLGYAFGSTDPTAGTPKPSQVKGRTILCLDKELISQHSPAFIATFILHELSHVADNRKLGEPAKGTITHYATEYKALAIQMMIHDELLRTGKLEVDTTDAIQLILSIYRWKNGGPKPNMDYSFVHNGRRYTIKKLIGMYVKPGDTGLKILWRFTQFINQLPEGTMYDVKDLEYLIGIRKFLKELEPKYQEWFPPDEEEDDKDENEGWEDEENEEENEEAEEEQVTPHPLPHHPHHPYTPPSNPNPPPPPVPQPGPLPGGNPFDNGSGLDNPGAGNF